MLRNMYTCAHTLMCFFFNDTATTEIYTLSLHDALPISIMLPLQPDADGKYTKASFLSAGGTLGTSPGSYVSTPLSSIQTVDRSEEHTSELQSRQYLVCRLLLEKKK